MCYFISRKRDKNREIPKWHSFQHGVGWWGFGDQDKSKSASVGVLSREPFPQNWDECSTRTCFVSCNFIPAAQMSPHRSLAKLG